MDRICKECIKHMKEEDMDEVRERYDYLFESAELTRLDKISQMVVDGEICVDCAELYI